MLDALGWRRFEHDLTPLPYDRRCADRGHRHRLRGRRVRRARGRRSPGQAWRSARPDDGDRADEHRRRHGQACPRAPGRRDGDRRPHAVPRRRSCSAPPSLLAGGRKPVSTPVVDLAVKQVLARSPGLYGPVHRHPSTVVALRDLYRELRVAGPTALTALARTARGNEPARVAAEVARLLAPSWYDEGDLLAAAALGHPPRPSGSAGPRRRRTCPSGCVRWNGSCCGHWPRRPTSN